MPNWLIADFLVAIHFAYVGFVVLSAPAIMVGGVLRWQWVRNSWFRHIHLLMIGIVVVEALANVKCPLTVWEKAYREAAGQGGFQGSFIGYWLHRLMFIEGDDLQWLLNILHYAFGALVVSLYLLVPPRWVDRFRRLRPAQST